MTAIPIDHTHVFPGTLLTVPQLGDVKAFGFERAATAGLIHADELAAAFDNVDRFHVGYSLSRLRRGVKRRSGFSWVPLLDWVLLAELQLLLNNLFLCLRIDMFTYLPSQ